MIVKLSPNRVYSGDPCKWAEKNCPSFEGLSVLTPNGEKNPMFISRYDSMCYHFGSEQDAVLFALRWA